MGKYDNATEEELFVCLKEVVSELNTEQILSYSDVASFFREEFNNEILDLWTKRFSMDLLSVQQEFLDRCRVVPKTQSEFRDYYIPILAKRIVNEADFDEYKVSGPFGLQCNYLIEFRKGSDKFYFSFFEQSLDGEIGVHREREGTLDLEYKPGTVGYYNQGNMDHVKLSPRTKIADIIEKHILKERDDD